MSLRQQNKARARASILSAAHKLMAEEGIQAATTREIAKRAGVSYQTLYNYFPTKADIAGATEAGLVPVWYTRRVADDGDYDGLKVKDWDGFLELLKSLQ